MFIEYPMLQNKEYFQKEKWIMEKNSNITLSSEVNNFLVENFYQTCCISRSSENMANCVRDILKLKKGNNGIINFDNLKYFFTLALYVLAIIGPLLIAVAFLTYLERKVIALVQYRKGPNVVGFFGLLQPFADGVKLFSKETIIPASSSKLIFVLAPMISFSLSLIAWSVIPVSENIVLSDINVGILYIFAVSSLSIYGIIMAGWASNSKYAF